MKVVCERKALLWLPDHVAYRQELDIAPQIERRALQAILAEKLHARGRGLSHLIQTLKNRTTVGVFIFLADQV